MSGAQETDGSRCESVLQCILSDFGMVAPPAAGCAPRTGSLEQDKIAQIVYEVMGFSKDEERTLSESLALVEIGGWSPAMVILDAMEKTAGVRSSRRS